MSGFQEKFGTIESDTYTPDQRKFFIDRITKFVFSLWGWGKEMSPAILGNLALKLGETIEATQEEKNQLRVFLSLLISFIKEFLLSSFFFFFRFFLINFELEC